MDAVTHGLKVACLGAPNSVRLGLQKTLLADGIRKPHISRRTRPIISARDELKFEDGGLFPETPIGRLGHHRICVL